MADPEGGPAPLITVIIPTRERHETLAYALRTALDQRCRSYEVLVCDNHSQDGTRGVVEAQAEARLRYINPGRRLSMCDNWEFALEHARGRYVTFIGDDDAVMPGAIDWMEGFIATHPSRSYAWPTPSYLWPIDDRPAKAELIPARRAPRVLDLRSQARKVMAMGGWRYYHLPGTYHAMVERSLLLEVKAATGRVFWTTTPDLFTSMAIPVFTERAVDTGRSITCQGRSAKSNGGSSLAKEGQQHLRRYIDEFGDYRSHPTLFTGITACAVFIADCFLVATDKFPAFYPRSAFGYSAMYAFLFRLKLVGVWEVLSQRRQIASCQPISTPVFLGWAALHWMMRLRRTLITALVESLVPRRANSPHVDIASFVASLPRTDQD